MVGEGKFIGGIFMMSNVDDACRVWDAKVDPQLIGELGSVEHLRQHITHFTHEMADPERGLGDIPATSGLFYGSPIDMQANELFWMTDCTPHESLPLPERTHRHYFRLVTGKVSHLYEKHSTPNPLGVEPDAEVLFVDKFQT